MKAMAKTQIFFSFIGKTQLRDTVIIKSNHSEFPYEVPFDVNFISTPICEANDLQVPNMLNKSHFAVFLFRSFLADDNAKL